MPSVWSHKADKDLLLAIIEEGSLKTLAWPKVSDRLSAKGYSFTKEACRQHFQKIRKESRNEAPLSDQNATATPQKRGKASSGASTPGNRSSKSQNSSFVGDANEDDEEEEMLTPLKRRKSMKYESLSHHGGFDLQNATMFKMENTGGNQSPIDLVHDDLYNDYA